MEGLVHKTRDVSNDETVDSEWLEQKTKSNTLCPREGVELLSVDKRRKAKTLNQTEVFLVL